MLSYESDDDAEFRAAWESSCSAEKQSHIAQRRYDKLDTKIENLKSRITAHKRDAEESLRQTALNSESLTSVQKRLGDVVSDIKVRNWDGRMSTAAGHPAQWHYCEDS